MEADDPRRGARKSAPGQPWSDAETMHLIDVYEDHWTKLRRGQLKAHQWEDVAAEVTHRCGGQRKTGTQCRHKLEKLRKRYRTEAARPVTSLWPFFRRMERLERGPVPTSTVSTNSFTASPPASDDDQDQDQDEDQEEEEEDEEEEQEEDNDDDEEEDNDDDEEEEQLLVARNSGSHTRSINGLVRDAGGFRGHQQQQRRRPSPPAVTLSTAPPRKRVSYEAAAFQSMAAAAKRVKVEEAPAVDHHSVAGVLRDIGDGIKRLERWRMEVQWEIERGWKETEARSNQMLQDAQRQLQDTLAALPPPGKKARRDHGSSADSL